MFKDNTGFSVSFQPVFYPCFMKQFYRKLPVISKLDFIFFLREEEGENILPLYCFRIPPESICSLLDEISFKVV